MGTLSTLYPRQILHASATLSVHGGLESAANHKPGPSGHETDSQSTTLFCYTFQTDH